MTKTLSLWRLLNRAAVAVAVVCAAFLANAQHEGTDEIVVVWGHTPGSLSLDPAAQGAGTDAPFMRVIFETLVQIPPRYNPDGSIPPWEPGLAERWEVDDSGTLWTFFLREGVQFHKGYGELTAEDVKFTYERLRDPANNYATRNAFKEIQDIVVVDDYTVQFVLTGSYAPFLHNLAMVRAGPIVSKRAFEEMGKDLFQFNPIGTGPYELVFQEVRGEIEVARFEDYWGERPQVDRFRLALIPDTSVQAFALMSGEIDYMRVPNQQVYEMLVDQPGIRIKAHPLASTSLWHMYLNTTREPLNDVRVRRAMLHALDREAIIDAFARNIAAGVAHSMVSPSHVGYPPPEDMPIYPYDPERARELLREAGLPDGFSVSINVQNEPFLVAVVTAIQGFWAEVGIELNIEVLERAVWAERLRAGDYYIEASFHTLSEVDRRLFHYHSANPPAVSGNYSFYSNPRVNELIEMQAFATREEDRVTMLAEIQKLVMEDVPILPIYHGVIVSAVSDRFVTGDNMHFGHLNIPYWRLKEE